MVLVVGIDEDIRVVRVPPLRPADPLREGARFAGGAWTAAPERPLAFLFALDGRAAELPLYVGPCARTCI